MPRQKRAVSQAPKQKSATPKKVVSPVKSAKGPSTRNSKVDEKLLYATGTYIAFLDPEEDLEKPIFKIGRATKNVKSDDKTFICDVYTLTKNLSYIKHSDKHQLADRTIVCEIPQVDEISAKKGKIPDSLKISRVQYNKIQKMVPNVAEKLQEEESNHTESEQEEESQILETQVQEKKMPMTQQPRKIKKIVGIKESKSKKVDEEMMDIEEPKKAKSATKVPQIGKKRQRDELDSDGEDSEDLVAFKKMKVKGGIKVTKVKVVKPKPKPTEYKKNVWNPNVELIDYDPNKQSKSNDLIIGCCTRCNNRNVFRAVFTENGDLLKKCVYDTKHISNLNDFWSPHISVSPLLFLIEKGDPYLMDLLLHPKLTLKKDEAYEQARDALYRNRVSNDQYLLNLWSQGNVSKMAYGTQIRQVGMTRGNREGNNAFMKNRDNDKVLSNSIFYHAQQLFINRKFSIKSIKLIEMLLGKVSQALNGVKQIFSQNLQFIVRSGDYKVASYLLKDLYKHSNYGFNELHYHVLQDYKKGELLPEFKSVSIHKKATNNYSITPMHFACINPNDDILRQLIAGNGDINVLDMEMRRPIHYAAACENTKNLKLLMEKGANLNDVDNRKVTPLHAAVIAQRPQNVKYLVEQNASLIKARDKRGYTPMAYACENADLETIKVLFSAGVKLSPGVGEDRITPLGWAAARGNIEMLKWLIENKARVTGNDKYKRCPLTLAVMNGHLEIVSILLQHGADLEQADSSGNRPLHYAAGYGWPECIELLLKTGADINAENSWRVSPINIAMLKNHQGCVKTFLNHPDVDVNGVDEFGRTLLTLTLLDLKESSVDFIKYLLEKGADPNKVDVDGQSAFHYLAQTDPNTADWQIPLDERPEYMKMRLRVQLKIADILLAHKASLTLVDSKKNTAFSICLEKDNIDLLEKLISGLSLNSNPHLLHSLKSKILNVKYQTILSRLLANDKVSKETINNLDDLGLTPFLTYIDQFCTRYTSLRAEMFVLVTNESKKHKDVIQKYEITNAVLFKRKEPEPPRFGRPAFAVPAFGSAPKKGKQRAANNNEADETDVYEDLPLELKNQFTDQLMDDLVVTPFLSCLSMLTSHGADPHSQVQKLVKYREIDEEKRKLALVKDAQEKVEVQAQIQERAKKREEVLKERRAQEKETGKKKKAVKKKVYNLMQNQSLLGQPAAAVTGEKESEYHSTMGLQNAFHLAISYPHSKLLDLLLKLKVNPEQEDFKKITPFNLMSTNLRTALLEPTFALFISNFKVKLDLADEKGRTPFLNFYQSSMFEYCYKLLDLGANVNQMDSSGMYALKYAMIRRSDGEINKLAKQYKANVNQVDGKGRNLLHHAVNLSSATADATFDTEQTLLDLGINVNLRDQKNRTPLHYAFVKIDDWKNKTQVDPIETVSRLCGCVSLEIDVPDKWLKTPLHYASQRGSSICALYLQKRGANLEAIDIYGNSPLGVAMLANHHHFAILLIQTKANVKKLVYNEDHEKIARMWREAEGQDEEMKDEEDKKHRKLFDKQQAKNVFYDSEYDQEDDDQSEEEDSDDQFEKNQFNQQNAFGFDPFNLNGKVQAPPKVPTSIFNQIQPAAEANKEVKEEEPKPMFRLAIRQNQLGLAYLMIDEGYDLMLAVQDAMDEKKFQLVLTLLAKTPQDSIIQQSNSKGQNLMHILSMNSKVCKAEHLDRIYLTLKKRGVNLHAKDGFKKTALHYAVENRNVQLVEHLLDEGLSTQDVDMYGFTPLAIYVKGAGCRTIQLYDEGTGIFDRIFECLARQKADVNFVYPEAKFDGIYSKNYSCTPIINFVRHLAASDDDLIKKQLRNALLGFLKFKVNFSICDSDGRDVMSHAIISNNLTLVNFLILHKKQGNLNTDNTDKSGKTAAHLVVSPCKFGSFENIDILDQLPKAGYNLNTVDKDGKRPLDYATHQRSGIMLKRIAQWVGLQISIPKRMVSGIKVDQWPKNPIDFEQDSELLMKEAQIKEEKEVKDKELVPVDKTGGFSKSHKVYQEGMKPWDAYLTKVDLRNGIYGDYVFYKMQMLFDSVRELYIVFTRYGKIGEDGMNQRTPFNNIEEAKKDFCSIFKSKTGNDFNDLENFTRVKKKYDIAKVNYTTVSHQDYLAPFDYEQAPKSKTQKEVRDLFEEISNVTMYQRAMNQLGLDNEMLPISGITKEIIQKAMGILNQIRVKVDEDSEIAKKGFQADLDALTAVREKQTELSSRFYELIPLSKYKNQIAPPLNTIQAIKTMYDDLSHLSNIEHASKLLLGALYRQLEVNPVDYIFQALSAKVDFVSESYPEYELLHKYIENTNQGTINYDTHKVKIFKIERYGELERSEEFNTNNFSEEEFGEKANRRLLFHGSSLVNYIGILSQGLRIAPPEAPTTGFMLGKGVYFADMFSKSHAYASNRFGSGAQSSILLMCEVALGNPKKFFVPEYVEKLEPQFHSVHGVGQHGPNYQQTVKMPNGVQVPSGPVINYKETYKGANGQLMPPMLQANEFVVFNTSQIRLRYMVQIIKKTKEELKGKK